MCFNCAVLALLSWPRVWRGLFRECQQSCKCPGFSSAGVSYDVLMVCKELLRCTLMMCLNTKPNSQLMTGTRRIGSLKIYVEHLKNGDQSPA